MNLLALGGIGLASLGLYYLFKKKEPTVKGSEFVKQYANKGLSAWEGAAFELAKQEQLTPREWVPIQLSDNQGNTAIIQVQNDFLAIGPKEDSIRLPLTPITAQGILNLYGWLLPTPWIVYQKYRNAPIKLTPTASGALGESNKGADLNQFAKHSAFLDRQIAGVLASTVQRISGPELIAGAKKHVVVSNIYQPKKVLIFGWYRPPPAPMVFDDGKPMADPNRQPIQPKSNVHSENYVDYSHGIQAVHPIAIVNGQQMNTVDLYQHPILSKLISNEGPVKYPRYPSSIGIAGVVPNRPVHIVNYPIIQDVVSTYPSVSDLYLKKLEKKI